MEKKVAERRQAPRFTLILPAEIFNEDGEELMAARSSDVSLVGCYIDTLNPAAVGTNISVRFRQDDETFSAAARVMYVCPGLGMGIKFDSDTPGGQMAILGRWLEQAATAANKS
jgi:hypothetical protein